MDGEYEQEDAPIVEESNYEEEDDSPFGSIEKACRSVQDSMKRAFDGF